MGGWNISLGMKQHVFPNKAEAGDVDVEDSDEVGDEDDGVFELAGVRYLLWVWNNMFSPNKVGLRAK